MPSRQRAGSALAIAFGTITMIIVLLATIATRLQGTKMVLDVETARLQATYAAEGAAALKETVLVNLAATNSLTQLETLTSQPGLNPGDANYGKAFGVQWLGNCVVRWRIEPIMLDNRQAASPRWSSNPPAAVADYATLNAATPTGMPANAYVTNYDYYNYRITTEAYYNPNFTASDTPWASQSASALRNAPVAAVQAVRVVQLRLNSLFKYAIFYAAEGPEGDLELGPGNGATVRVAGATPRNGAIYLGGGGNGGLPVDDGGGSYFGGVNGNLNGQSTTVTGVDGIYRMVKAQNLRNSFTSPLAVPAATPGNATGTTVSAYVHNLNSRSGTDNRFQINDRILTAANDSRSPSFLSANFGSWVRDGVTLGATVVKTLANIPQLAGRPFEAQSLAPSGSAVYTSTPLSPTTTANWTLRSTAVGGTGDPTAQLYARVEVPTGPASFDAASSILATTASNAARIAAGDPPKLLSQLSYDVAGTAIIDAFGIIPPKPLRALDPNGFTLYTQAPSVTDIAPPNNTTSPEGFNVNETSGGYLINAQLGTSQDPGLGLIVRERPAQDLTWWPGSDSGVGSIRAALWNDQATRDAINRTGGNFFVNASSSWLGADGSQNFPRPDPQWPVYTGTPGAFSVDAGATTTVVEIPAEAYDPALSIPVVGNGVARVSWLPYRQISGSGIDRRPTSIIEGATPSTRGLPAAWSQVSPAAAPWQLTSLHYLSALTCYPDRHRSFLNTDAAPTLSYRTTLPTGTGTFDIWLRGMRPPGGGGSSANVHIGMRQVVAGVPQAVTWYGPLALTNSTTQFGWSRLTVAVVGDPPGIDASNQDWILDLKPAQDGVIIDEIAISRSSVSQTWNNPWGNTGTNILPPNAFTMTGGSPPQRSYERDMILYLKSQYAAWVGGFSVNGSPLDNPISPAGYLGAVTSGFFGWQGDQVDCLAQPGWSSASLPLLFYPVAYEGDIMNRREADFMRMSFGVNSCDAHNYRVNTLTFNLDRVQDYIRRCPWSQVDTAYAGADCIQQRFSGLLYAARTRRSQGYVPGVTPLWNPANYPNLWGGFNPRRGDNTAGTNPTTGDASANMLPNNRVGPGPDAIFHSAIRVAQGALIDWGARDTAANNRRRGFTVITPNPCSVLGDFNVVPDPAATTNASPPVTAPPVLSAPPNFSASPLLVSDATLRGYIRGFLYGSSGSVPALYVGTAASPVYNGGNGYKNLGNDSAQCLNFPPCAIFSDGLSVMSDQWADEGLAWASSTGSGDGTSADNGGVQTRWTSASETFYHYSAITNNIPTDTSNIDASKSQEGSGGTHNAVRYIENWGGSIYHTRGSLVVMNRMHYSRGDLGANSTPGYYQPPQRDLRFNTDLLQRSGQPPFTPFGVQVIRTVSTLNVLR